jgi:acetyl-CoA carboxylase carboxyl transferase subunit alpha
MEVFDRVLAARAKDRPTGADFIQAIFTDFTQMHGDRRFGDDQAVVTGIAYLGDIPVTVAALEKGHDTKSRVASNFGSAHPEGYRKTLRQFALAQKFRRPVILFVDTSGAYCGTGAEERGQGLAIAENMTALMSLGVPVISVLTGEGGSGGALALAVADSVWMLENAIYSVISPEGCASILWKDPARTREAAQHLKLTAEDLLALGIIDRIIPETGGFEEVYKQLREDLYREVEQALALAPDVLRENRYSRFRKMGGAAL